MAATAGYAESMNSYEITLSDQYGFVYGVEYATFIDEMDADTQIEEIIANYKRVYGGRVYADVEAL